jgi:uroporphyrinogen decarboxylase
MDIIATLTPPPVGDVDLAEAKKRVGDKTCLKGNIDLIYVLLKGTPELVRKSVREAIDAAADGGGFILSTSDSIREGTPVENVRAYSEAAREYGVRV